MSELSLIDFLAYKRTQIPSRVRASDAHARLALNMCERKILHKDWEGFGRWFRVLRESKRNLSARDASAPTNPPVIFTIEPAHGSERMLPS